jgi:GNAT superfamily N-acetyltransferase
MQVHGTDGYPLHLPAEEESDFFTSGHETAAWVADLDGRIVGHVALRCPPEDPTLELAQRATGLPVERFALLARLFVAPELRRSGLGRVLPRHAAGSASRTCPSIRTPCSTCGCT